MSLLPFSVAGPSSPWDLLAWIAVGAALLLGVVNLWQEFFADRPEGWSRAGTPIRPAGSRSRVPTPSGDSAHSHSGPRSAP